MKELAILNKSLLVISGNHALNVLNNITTQDISQINNQEFGYTLFLNNKGRVLFSCIIYKASQNTFYIEIEPELLMDLAKHINKYDMEKSLDISIAEDKVSVISFNKQENFSPDPRNNKLPYKAILDKKDLSSNKDILDKFENLRLELAIPENHDFIHEKSLANDLNIEELNGVSFTKGCYLGQELTSKTKHIKDTKNQLICLDNTMHKVSTNNCIVYLNEQKVGQTFSFNSTLVLAIIKRSSKDELNNLIIKQS